MTNEIELGVTADLHVHLREGDMKDLIVPTVKQGGISIVYVMPNLSPPITTIERVRQYKSELEALDKETIFLMSFYLHSSLTPELVREAGEKGLIHGIKCYPAGVTTNSKEGVDPNDFSKFYEVFEVMQSLGLVLNIHGEKPGHSHGTEDEFKPRNEEEDINILNAEKKFLPALKKLHEDFPKLKIVLEHCTTSDSVALIRELNKGKAVGDEIFVGATITAHHLFLTIDQWAGNPINYCKPVAKFHDDKLSLVGAATSGEPWFFFGSDSAPHPIELKCVYQNVCAGVFTQSHAVGYLAEVFDKVGKLSNLIKFVSNNGIKFYNVASNKHVGAKYEELKSNGKKVWLIKRKNDVPKVIGNSKVTVVPFKAGEQLEWTIEWR
ncbi:Dihydroorotase [Scheffersomyces amazonensis]|uniref:Dihydroorotase n=1 Tax=Scheffersomyces amazonensis TaxID=1078765 RepID=UPI00315D8A22